jgi:hypothetical protein
MRVPKLRHSGVNRRLAWGKMQFAALSYAHEKPRTLQLRAHSFSAIFPVTSRNGWVLWKRCECPHHATRVCQAERGVAQNARAGLHFFYRSLAQRRATPDAIIDKLDLITATHSYIYRKYAVMTAQIRGIGAGTRSHSTNFSGGLNCVTSFVPKRFDTEKKIYKRGLI